VRDTSIVATVVRAWFQQAAERALYDDEAERFSPETMHKSGIVWAYARVLALLGDEEEGGDPSDVDMRAQELVRREEIFARRRVQAVDRALAELEGETEDDGDGDPSLN